MTWMTTTHAGHFLENAMPFSWSDPVASSVLLTEAHFWSRLSPGVSRQPERLSTCSSHGSPEAAAELRSLGFAPVLDRVVLELVGQAD